MFIQRRKIVWIEPFMIRENFDIWLFTQFLARGKVCMFCTSFNFPWFGFCGHLCLASCREIAAVKCRSCLWAPRISILDTGYYISRCFLAPHSGRENGWVSIYFQIKISTISPSKFKFLCPVILDIFPSGIINNKCRHI